MRDAIAYVSEKGGGRQRRPTSLFVPYNEGQICTFRNPQPQICQTTLSDFTGQSPRRRCAEQTVLLTTGGDRQRRSTTVRAAVGGRRVRQRGGGRANKEPLSKGFCQPNTDGELNQALFAETCLQRCIDLWRQLATRTSSAE